MIHFAAVGHVTNDRLETGLFPGGAALYAALTAAQLQAKPKILTSCGPDFIGLELTRNFDVEMQISPSEPRSPLIGSTSTMRYPGSGRPIDPGTRR